MRCREVRLALPEDIKKQQIETVNTTHACSEEPRPKTQIIFSQIQPQK